MREAAVKNKIRLLLGTRQGLRLFTNPCGVGWIGQFAGKRDDLTVLKGARRVEFGLTKGSADLIGWQSVIIRQEDVGKTFARFVALEIKTDKGRIKPEQQNFVNQVLLAGGAAGIARSVDDAERILGE